MAAETAHCHKCKSEISPEAERCPECGYEPSNIGAVSQIIGFLALLGFSFCMLIVVITPILIADSLALSSGITSFAVFGIGALFTGLILYSLYLRTKLKPTGDESVELLPSHRD